MVPSTQGNGVSCQEETEVAVPPTAFSTISAPKVAANIRGFKSPFKKTVSRISFLKRPR